MTNSQTPTVAAESSKSLPAPDAQIRVSQFMKRLQDEITESLAKLDGVAKFNEDSWERPEGGMKGNRACCEKVQYLNKQV